MNWLPRLSSGPRLRRAAIAVALPMVALTTIALPATTSPANASSCPQFGLCTWQNANFSGTQWNFTVTSGQPAGHWWYVGNAANDQISSIINNHTSSIAYFNKDCPAGSDWAPFLQLSSNSNLTQTIWPDGSNMNDSISAWGVGTSLPAHGNC